ncbi:hypothetical protein [Vibrio sp. SCSIO 43155]|uniref:hypothetical protein n=1 Tax=Vibrio TaxID=662 RepID=UPI002075EC53|nr:hypothetical protein [Vibrio sp. SCSIO 43155]USD58560.1 hypothetical protein J4N44_26780 [Vibrio sp. SCSIO 43155]
MAAKIDFFKDQVSSVVNYCELNNITNVIIYASQKAVELSPNVSDSSILPSEASAQCIGTRIGIDADAFEFAKYLIGSKYALFDVSKLKDALEISRGKVSIEVLPICNVDQLKVNFLPTGKSITHLFNGFEELWT